MFYFLANIAEKFKTLILLTNNYEVITFLVSIRIFLFFCTRLCSKRRLPPWVFENQEGLYLGVSEVMDDAGLALLQAQTRAVLNFCLTQGLPFKTITTSEIDVEGKKESTRRLEAARLELSGFECALEKLYAHPSGEYFVLCRVKQGKPIIKSFSAGTSARKTIPPGLIPVW